MAGYYLGVDIGTYESKGVLIDGECRVIAVHTERHGLENPRKNTFIMICRWIEPKAAESGFCRPRPNYDKIWFFFRRKQEKVLTEPAQTPIILFVQ